MILQGDCLEVLKSIKDNTIDSLVTDPPYSISFMSKSWDEALPSVDLWKEVYRVMKPGAFGFIMCIPRQDCLSRMMISLEDAGFNINFSSLYWTFATGFPKSLNMGKAVDKRLGKEREVVGEKPNICGYKDGWDHKQEVNSDLGKKYTPILNDRKPAGQITAPASDEAKRLEGSYGGFQPKPAVEVIIVVMKPLSEGSYINQAMKDGKGVVWFDDCRIPYVDENPDDGRFGGLIGSTSEHFGQIRQGARSKPNFSGRFPANLLVSDDVLDDGRNDKKGKTRYDNRVSPESTEKSLFGLGKQQTAPVHCGDSGGFSRFYSLDAWAEKNLPFLIVPKASKKEKNMGCEGLKKKKIEGVEGYEPKDDYNSLNVADKYLAQRYSVASNNHPTVKTIKLMSYLITMGSRPGDTILDPFAGSGTTGCACLPMERKCVLIEREDEYIEIIKARLDYYKRLPLQF